MFKVLIAEDEPPIMRMIKSTLESVDSDFKVTECCINGKNAVEKLKNEDFDIVITDIKMPIMNGLEATRIIREEGRPGSVKRPGRTRTSFRCTEVRAQLSTLLEM